MVWSTVNLDFSGYRIGGSAVIKLMGGSTLNGSDFADSDTGITTSQVQDSRIYTNIFHDKIAHPEIYVSRILQYFGEKGTFPCPTGWNPSSPFSANDKQIFANFINQTVFAQERTLTFLIGSPPSKEYYKYPAVEMMMFSCQLSPGRFARGKIHTHATHNVIPPPQDDVSICSLNSQNLNLTYSSTNLNVDGLAQTTSMNVSCTAGNAQDYELKLTGNNVINGRLNFSNGVSAQISLNGTNIRANGDGIKLKSLTNGVISVYATLVGTASNAGISNASGVLVLNAL